MKSISVLGAKYEESFKIEIVFSDDKIKLVDFEFFLQNSKHPKYKKEENFKRFKIENGNVVWGNNWDMIFPVYDLYIGKIN